jgi:drug/metabolite transporter (DMT)-like permease
MADTQAMERATVGYAHGALFGLAAVSIWAGNIVVGGLGLRSSLTPWDITAIRFGVAGVVLLPLLMRRGLALEHLGWLGVAALVMGGAPPVILVNAGLLFAPASQAGALFPGVMPLMVAGLAAALGMEAFTRHKQLGCALIAAGVLAMIWGSGGGIGTIQNIGHLLFLAAALAFACYTVAMRRGSLNGLHAAAISAVGSMMLYLPPYALVAGADLFAAPSGAIALQALVAGSPDRGDLLRRLRSCSGHSRRFQRRGFRSLLTSDDGLDGDPHPGPVAVGARLDCDHAHLDRRICRERRPDAKAAPAASLLLTWFGQSSGAPAGSDEGATCDDCTPS